jgi:hypothetical protein
MPEETIEECRKRLCKPDEDAEECQERLKKERERLAEERQEKAEKEQEEAKERQEERREEQEKQQKEREQKRDRDRGDDDDDDDGGSSSSSDVLRPGTRPMFFSGGVGPTFFGLNRGRRNGLGRLRAGEARAKIALDFGYHFSGDFEGPAIGASIEQSFNDAFYVINPSFKFWWDIQPVDDYGIYIAPFAKAGYAAALCGENRYGCPYHAFNIGAGVEGRLILNDRGLVFLRPVQIDTYLGNFFGDTFWLNFSVVVGGGVIF